MSLYRGAGGASDATDDSTVNAVAGYASAAASSASAAATSATNASNSATAAASSASGAASSASSVATNAANASSSAGLANTYATAASNSKDAAAASAVTASTKAGEASTSASNAATSASTATTKASEAATSATNAANNASASASSAASALAIYGNTAAVNAAVAAAAASAATSAIYADASNEVLSYVNFSRDEATAAADDASAWASASQASSNDAQGYATAALSARDMTLAAYDNFDDRYLGVKPLDPSTDNDGNPLIAGTLYFNQVSEMMKLYTGTAWVAAYTSGGSPAFDNVTIAGSTTLSGLTANRIPYLNASKVLTTDASSLTYDGSGNMSVSGFLTAGSLSLSNGTANSVPYLNASKIVVTGTALTFDGSQLDIPAGTAAAPSLSTTADTNTGIFFPAADTIAFSEGGVEAMRINSSGNVGIGTSSPGVTLDVTTALTTTAIRSLGSGTAGADTRLILASSGNGGTGRGVAISFQPSGSANSVEAVKLLGLQESASATANAAAFVVQVANTSGTLTERARIDSSGNLGLGVTPSAWSSSYKVLQIGSTGSVYSSNSAALANNFYVDSGGTNRYLTSSSATAYIQNTAGTHAWYTAPSGTTGNAITFTTAMTLNASGNLGLGVTPSAWSGAAASIQLPNSGNIATSGSGMNLLANAYYNGTAYTYVASSTASHYRQLSGTHAWFTAPSGTAGNAITFTQAMTLDASGNLLVGNTSVSSTPTVGAVITGASTYGFSFVAVGHATGTATGSQYAQFAFNGGAIGSITQNGTTAVAYNTSSDYRLKENIQPMTGALAKVAQLKPVTYTWKADGSAGEGFIAHELAEVCPQAVTGEKDAVEIQQYEISPAVPATYDEEGNELTPAVEAVMGEREVPKYQGIDVSFLVGTLTAAIQEQQAMIQELTARVAQLESK